MHSTGQQSAVSGKGTEAALHASSYISDCAAICPMHQQECQREPPSNCTCSVPPFAFAMFILLLKTTSLCLWECWSSPDMPAAAMHNCSLSTRRLKGVGGSSLVAGASAWYIIELIPLILIFHDPLSPAPVFCCWIIPVMQVCSRILFP